MTIVNTAVALAVSVFNGGAKSYASVKRKCGLEMGPFALKCFENIDCERIKSAQRQAKAASHEARLSRRRGRKSRDEEQAEREGFPYLAGG